MFPVSFLFSLPDYQLCCVRTLHYLFSYMVQQHLVFPSLDYFSLVPSPHLHEGVFLQTENNNKYMYCDLPRGFHIRCGKQIPDTACPHADHHHLHALLTELVEECTTRYASLAKLFRLLVQEKGCMPLQTCLFCIHRKETVDALMKSLMKPYPYLTRSSIEMFYRFPVRKGVDVEKILQPHITSVHLLFSQIRNPSLRENLLEGIYDAFQELQDEVEIAVENNDDDQMTHCAKRFKNRVLDTIDQCCPLVQVRKVDFKRWLLTLVYFSSLQDTTPLDNEDTLKLVKKAMLLMHLYFHTRVVLPKNALFYVENDGPDADAHARQVNVSVDALNKVHPALRGEYLCT